MIPLLKPGLERVRFMLQIDGRNRAMDVTIGKTNAHPPANPFVAEVRNR